MGRRLGLFAGGYTVRINNSDAHADVSPGESTNVPAGNLEVRGSTEEYYSVLNNAGVQLASAHLEKPLAFVPGTYNVKVNDTTTPATIAPGVTTEIKTGAVVLQFPLTSTTPSLIPLVLSWPLRIWGTHSRSYRARIAPSSTIFLPVNVDAGKIAEYHAGSLR